ncbi:conserved hypothetical protein [Trichinella spiralis]|uniref:hypothetical protein n=1 Tax=Trichinella spiralis TaxID=6334 RepID=UPI0001EFCD87|nr:conserved hypothetical protein [Trichinella spiralis]
MDHLKVELGQFLQPACDLSLGLPKVPQPLQGIPRLGPASPSASRNNSAPHARASGWRTRPPPVGPALLAATTLPRWRLRWHPHPPEKCGQSVGGTESGDSPTHPSGEQMLLPPSDPNATSHLSLSGHATDLPRWRNSGQTACNRMPIPGTAGLLSRTEAWATPGPPPSSLDRYQPHAASQCGPGSVRSVASSHGLQAGQHPFQAFQVLLLCLPEDDNIVEIDEARFPRQPPQRFLHQTLKRRRGVAESERHDADLKESQGCGKRRFLPVSLSDFYLPVARRQIERAEPLGPRQRIQHIIYSRDGLGIDARHSVQIAANRPSFGPALLVNSRGLRLVRLPPCAAFPGLAGPPPPAGLGEGGGVAASPAGPLRSRCGALQGLFVRGRPRRARWPSRISGVCCVGPSYCARNTPLHPLGYVSNHSTHRHRLLRQIPHSVAPPQPRSQCWAGRHFLPLAGTSLSSRLSGPSSET